MADSPSDRPDPLVKSASDDAAETVVPLLEEQVDVSKRTVAQNRVRVSRVTQSREQLIDEQLARERVEIERTPVGRAVDAMPAVREEGDTTVIPIVEEVLKIERQLMLKEEVRIRRVKDTQPYQERVTLRKQEAVVSRLPVEERLESPAISQTGPPSDSKE